MHNKVATTATAALVAALTNPLVAEASVTPSLKNTLLSVVAGGVVLGAIAAAVIGVSSFDKVSRKWSYASLRQEFECLLFTTQLS